MPFSESTAKLQNKLKKFGLVAAGATVAISLPPLLGVNHNEPFLAWQLMPFNTAVGLFTLGLALAASILNRKKEASLLAIFIAALSLTTLFEHLGHVNLGIDQIFHAAESSADQEFPGRMSLLSSLSLTLLSASLLLQNFRTGRFMAIAGFFAGTAAAIGLLSPLGAHVSAHFDVAAATKMSKASGVGIFITASYLFSWIVLRLRSDSEQRFRVIPLLLTNALTFALLLGWQYSIKQQEETVRAELQVQADQAGRIFSERFAQTQTAISRFASRISLLGTRNKAFLRLDSANYASQLPSIRRIGITDSNFNVIWSYPEDQQYQVRNFNQASDPIRRQTFEASRDAKTPMLSPFFLKTGETGCLLSAPMFSQEHFEGSTYATFSVDRLFADFIPEDQFSLTIKQAEVVIYERSANSELAMGLELRQKFESGFAKLEIVTIPTRAYVQSLIPGTPFWILLVGEALIVLLGLLIANITRSSQVRRQFHEREKISFRRLNNALEAGKMGAFSLDFETGSIWRSENNDKIFGYSNTLDNWTMKEVMDRIPPEDRDLYLENQKVAFASRDLQTREFRIRRADDNSLRWLRVVSQTAFNDDGKAIYSEGLLTDVTAEKTIALELSVAYSRLQRLVESSGEGIWERNYDTGEVMYFDAACLSLFGFDREHKLELGDVNSRLFDEDRAMITKVVDDHCRDKTPGFVFDFRIRDHRNPKLVKWARARGQVLHRADGIRYLVCTLRDVSDEVATRRQLELAVTTAQQAVQAKATFLANMSHEIRTPLNGLLGMTDLLLETGLNATQKTYAQIAQASGASLLTLINDVLDFSKIEAGKLELGDSQFNIAAVVESQIEILTAKAKAKNLTLASFIAPDVPIGLLGDADRLGQVLLNLIGNAIKFTSSGGVMVTVERTRDSVDSLTVRVRDTGIGISEKACAQLFNPFVQADADISKTYGGTGLGLSISKKIIETMGGTIGIESTPGLGSTFWFKITLRAVREIAHARKVGWEKLIEARTLIIESDAIAGESLQSYVLGFKMRGESCATLDEAVLKLNAPTVSDDAYSLVIVGQTNGLTATAAIEKLRSDVSIKLPVCVLVSEFGVHEDAETLVKAGYAGSTNKPIKQSLLLDLLVSALNAGDRNFQETATTTAGAGPHASFESLVAHRDARILIADDVPVNLMLTQKMLEFLGFKSTTAANGQQVLDLLEKEQFDLILMDCQMPVLDGFQATRAIRQMSDKRTREIPIIALTANAVSGDQQLCINAGMNDYLSKPMKKDQLAEKLNRWLATANRKKSA